ncbi:MAG: hypothetical protein ACM30G_05000 [Micromonosporaceae bacterium]
MNQAAAVGQLDLWKVARVYEPTLPKERREELYAWLESLQVQPKLCIPHLVITHSSLDGRYRLHLSRFALDDRGAKYVDHAADRVHTEPLVIVIDTWPEWLVEVSQQQEN